MAMEKRSTPPKAAKPERAPQITPMPFPGESPTVSLALAAARKYGFQEAEEKPAKPQRKRRAAPKKAKPARKSTTRRGKRARTPAR